MDKIFLQSYYKYFLWNNGLINYYFTENRYDEEVLLYSDESVFKQIGESVGINDVQCLLGDHEKYPQLTTGEEYKNDFLKCVKDFCNHYNDYWSRISQNVDLYKSISNKEDVLAVAKEMIDCISSCYCKYYSKDSRKSYIRDNTSLVENKIPYFAIAIYVISKFENKETGLQKWDNIPEISTSSHRFIKKIWAKIEEYDIRFDKDASIFDLSRRRVEDYAGRIRYHLVLKKSERDYFESFLFRKQIEWDPSIMTYSDFVNTHIYPLLTDNKEANNLREIIQNNENDEYLKNLILGFDRDKYAKSHPEENIERLKGSFFNVLDCNTGEFSLRTDICVSESVQDEFLCIPHAYFDNSFNLYPVETKKSIKYGDIYSYKDDKYYITSSKSIFFQFYDGYRYLVQTDSPSPGAKCMITFGKSLQQKAKNLIIKLNAQKNDNYGELGQNVYYVDCWNSTNYIKTKGKDCVTKSKKYEWSLGVRSNSSRKNSYFVQALPCLQFSDANSLSKVDLFAKFLKKDDEESTVEMLPMQTETNAQCLFLDIPEKYTDYPVMYLFLKYKEKDTFECLGVFNLIKNQELSIDTSHFIKHNEWGLYDKSGRHCNNDIIDGERIPNQSRPCTNNWEKGTNVQGVLLVNLLKEICNERREFGDPSMRAVLQHVSCRLGILIDETKHKQRIKHLLMNLGYVSRDFINGSARYQVNTPMLIQIPVGAVNGVALPGQNWFLLYGGYTSQQYKELLSNPNYKNHIFVKSPYSEEQLHNEPLLKLLPDNILVDYTIVDCVASVVFNNCKVIKDSLLSETYFSYSAEISNFDEQFTPQSIWDVVHPKPRIVLPRVIKNNNNDRFHLETERGIFETSGDGQPLPTDIIRLYVQHKRKQPVIYINGVQRGIGDSYSYRSGIAFKTTTMGIPYLIKKALYMQNLGIPKRKKYFVIDDVDSVDLYSYFDYYENIVPSALLVEKLSGLKNLPLNRFHDNDHVKIMNIMDICNDYSIILRETEEGHRNHCELILNKGASVQAFALYNKGLRCYSAFIKVHDDFFEVKDMSVNETFSLLLNNKEVGQEYVGNKSKEPIIDKNYIDTQIEIIRLK